jgi:hypothetical protein
VDKTTTAESETNGPTVRGITAASDVQDLRRLSHVPQRRLRNFAIATE